MKIHRSYSDKRDRPDLRSLALCNNINGAVFDEDHLTSKDAEVTCGRCRRIMGFSPAALRRISRDIR